MVLLEPEAPIAALPPELNDSPVVEPRAAALELLPPPSAESLSSVIVNDPRSISDAPWNGGAEIETVRPRPRRRIGRVLLVAACAAGMVALGVTAFVTRLRAADLQEPAATANASPMAVARVTPAAAPAAAPVAAKIDPPPETTPPAAARERDEQTPSSPSAAQASAASAPEASEPPSYVHGPTVSHRIWLALRRAERCQLDGRAVGSAEVFVTFSPNGRVSAARIEGEPVASAPVARCILDQARSIRIAKFDGDEFTLHQSIVLR
jgi:hypothetical protein